MGYFVRMQRLTLPCLALCLLTGCPAITAEDFGARLDLDGDGYDDASLGGDDCDDSDASAHPGATDTPYDDVDADCSGGSDNDADGETATATPTTPTTALRTRPPGTKTPTAISATLMLRSQSRETVMPGCLLLETSTPTDMAT